ncbi:MAG TPA: hypothetical protein VGN37_28040 [Actinocatenispora sp.]
MTHTPWGPGPQDPAGPDDGPPLPSDVTGPLPASSGTPADDPTGYAHRPGPPDRRPAIPGGVPGADVPAGAPGPGVPGEVTEGAGLPGGTPGAGFSGAVPGAGVPGAVPGAGFSGGVPGAGGRGGAPGVPGGGGPPHGYEPAYASPWMAPPPNDAWSAPATSGRRTTVAIIAGLGALVLLAVCGIGAWAYTASDDPTPTRAGSAASGGPAGGGPAPATRPSSAGPGDRLSQAEYDDWRFRLGGVALSADKTGGRDFASCAPMEQHASLTDHGCRYGIELDYTAEHDQIRFLHMILVFDTAAHAKQVDAGIGEDDLAVDRKALHPADAMKDGKWTHRTTNEYLVVTFCTTSSDADTDRVGTYLHYASADEAAALLWRD